MKRCSTCNRTYADDTLTFCLADGTLLSAPYDSQATEILPTLPKTIPSPPPVWALAKSVAPESPRKGNRLPYVMAALLLLIIGMTMAIWWVRRLKQNIQSRTTVANPLTLSTPTPASEQTNQALSKSSSSTATPPQQQAPVIVQAPTATPDEQKTDEVLVVFSSSRFNSDHRENGARLDDVAGKIGNGEVENIFVTAGKHISSGTQIMEVKAFVTQNLATTSPETLERTIEKSIAIESSVTGTVVKILVSDKQRIHPNDVLMIIRKD